MIDRVGGSKPVPVDIRIIATSNRDLVGAVKEGNFREDLYYRLNVINLELPPLRARKADIVPLADFFVKKYSEANGVKAKPISLAAQNAMLNASWRGNVRELENAVSYTHLDVYKRQVLRLALERLVPRHRWWKAS